MVKLGYAMLWDDHLVFVFLMLDSNSAVVNAENKTRGYKFNSKLASGINNKTYYELH